MFQRLSRKKNQWRTVKAEERVEVERAKKNNSKDMKEVKVVQKSRKCKTRQKMSLW